MTVTNPRAPHRDRADPGLHLTLRLITMAHHPTTPSFVRKISVRGNESFDLGLDRFGQQQTGTGPQYLR